MTLTLSSRSQIQTQKNLIAAPMVLLLVTFDLEFKVTRTRTCLRFLVDASMV